MTVDDIKAVSAAAYQKALSSNKTLASKTKKKRKVKDKIVSSDLSLPTSLPGSETSSLDTVNLNGSVTNVPRRNNSANANFVLLEGGAIGESDESLNQPLKSLWKHRVRPGVRNHKFVKKSEPDLAALSLNSLTSIPENGDFVVDFSANVVMPSFDKPVVMGKFRQQAKQETVQGPTAGPSGLQNVSKPNNTNKLASYAPTKEQLKELEATMPDPLTHSTLWSSQISEASDGVLSMYNLVQQETQADSVRDTVRQLRNACSEKTFVPMSHPDGHKQHGAESGDVKHKPDEAHEPNEEQLPLPDAVRRNWILKDSSP